MPRTATAIADQLNSGRLRSIDVLRESFRQIDAREGEVRAFISQVDRDRLEAEAARIDSARAAGHDMGRFAGVPIAVKDNIAVQGHPLTAGSKILGNYVAQYDATVTDRLKRAGLLIIGKTNMDEFGFGSSTENSSFHVTANPENVEYVPGGSSGGSAAAVSAGFVPWALGTDTGGSVRQPAAFCGVVGHRPTYGGVSRSGVIAFASSMDQVGPLATSVEDAAALLDIVGGVDGKDSTSISIDTSEVEDLPSIRVGIAPEYLTDSCSSDVLAAVESVTAAARGLGWSVHNVSLPTTRHALSAYYVLASVEAASNLARYDGVRYGYRDFEAVDWEEMVTRTRTEGFGPEAKRRIILGTFASSAGYQDKYYLQAKSVRHKLAAEVDAVHDDVDILISPVSPTAAWKLGELVTDPVQMYLSDVFSVPAALAGTPATSIPVSKNSDGLPLAVQVSGRQKHDALVLHAAERLSAVLAY
ncbi:Asp-tRNA(Asn)/Glu-tRNA(Gln) amidotransferase subunit GatA [Nocardia asteroides]|uniref:Asp-tRNA(Asn)/Glu-tRNA(Gln) amidotransferase subunit GatA n=1 Tax=Nocardia asteroides TaxID=1824 RepID=UPI001E40702D|nr:Asp-tRNA(Asn)/Glu-tRNA(Gln) amidotransferase subunit GatA [Nocardia asteroides]UGT58466.1 Asp-tRNA(Asn)/Glu-tRNA(Gln) amidotransferase subunit GatA [Nocardia asteroides]